MSSSAPDLTLLQANLLAAVVAASGSTAMAIGEVVESVYGLDLPKGGVYNQLSRLETMDLIEKSASRGTKGKAITPTATGRELVLDRYEWIVDRMQQVDEV